MAHAAELDYTLSSTLFHRRVKFFLVLPYPESKQNDIPLEMKKQCYNNLRRPFPFTQQQQKISYLFNCAASWQGVRTNHHQQNTATHHLSATPRYENILKRNDIDLLP